MKSKLITMLQFVLIFICANSTFSLSQTSYQAPPNEPAEVRIEGKNITITYNGKNIFAGIIKNPSSIKYNVIVDSSEDQINQVIVFNAVNLRDVVEISGEISGSEEAFPCEVDRKLRGLNIVRHSYGLSKSLLNRAVYDRKWDSVLSVDRGSQVMITPVQKTNGFNKFSVSIRGSEVVIRFRPRYYQKHRGLYYFKPWTYKVWKKPVVGWCSWFAFFAGITEKDVLRTADVISEVLAPFGYEYLQIDDGYQSGNGLPDLWLNPNEKFPNGLEYLVEYIKSKGLKPGIWTNVSFNQKDFAEQHKDWFVTDENGDIATGRWIDMSLDGSNSEAVDKIVRPVYSGLKQMGWEYYKVDALRHLRYEGYNSNVEYFKRRNVDRVEAYRSYVKAVREEIGRDYFMLGCWGIRPELIGIIDGCRIGTDGYSFAGLSQYNSFNNVVWLNDPDHIELSDKEAFRSTMVTSLTGSLFLLTDKPERYYTKYIEPAKRAAPVLFTVPGQIYDVDPSSSENLLRVNSEVSGSGPRVFDASLTPKCHLYLLEINKSYESWVMLGRTGGNPEIIRFNELGLPGNKEYIVFEFWSKTLIGSFTEGFSPGEIDAQYKCQLFCIRERKLHPQIIATNRHITCGGFDLPDVKWIDNKILGKSKIVANDLYTIYITEPEGYTFKNFSCNGAELVKIEKEGTFRLISVKTDIAKDIDWKIEFNRTME